MKPIALHLRGSIGVRDGMGLNEIHIDFTRFSPGLICIVGPNGSGKTSILDNMHPYLCLASRDGHLATHFYLEDSCRDFTFEMGEVRYRSLIVIDATTSRSEAYLYKDDIPLNDGKIASYKDRVNCLIGPPEVFFQSIFQGQGAAGFTDLEPAKRKELFFELLNLQQYEVYSQYAREHADELERQLAAKKAVIGQYETELQSRPKVLAGLENARVRQAALGPCLQARRLELEQLIQAEAELRKKSEAQARMRQESCELDEELRLLDVRMRNIGESYVREKAKHNLRIDAIKKDLEGLRSICSRKVETLARLEELKALRDQSRRLDALASEAYKINQKESEARALFQSECERYLRNRSKLTTARDRLLLEERLLRKTIDHERSVCEGELERARKEASLIDAVACRSIIDLPERCLLLSKAIQARNEIPELECRRRILQANEYVEQKGGGQLRDQLLALDAQLTSLDYSAPVFDEEGFARLKASLGYSRTEHEELCRQISAMEHDGYEELAGKVDVAENVEHEKRAAIAGINDQIADLRSKYESAQGELKALVVQKKAARNGLELEHDILEEQSYEERTIEVKKNLEELQKEQLACAGQVAIAQSTLEKLEALALKTQQAQGEAHCLGERITDWRLIQRACSKDGIPALELDAAGPAISRIANALLASSFGSRFQIRFETTRLSKNNKKQLETFDARIYGEDGEKSIADLSGGEQVWIERAISEAIAIHLSENSKHSFQTTFQDEADGPLDPENKHHYLAMLRESFRLGRRSYAFIVTQTPDIWQQVDQRIHLDPERSEIQLVCGA